jgi:putative phosphoribosyl transferase
MIFQNRYDAGRQLARRLDHLAGRDDLIVLALPRGGVPVASEVARALGAPLDVLIVRKIGTPGREELAVGAIASGGVIVVNEEIADQLGITPGEIRDLAVPEQIELARRQRIYRDDRPFPDLHDKVVVLVDDGLATGSTMRAAVQAVRKLGPARIVVAVPVGAGETCSRLRKAADEVVCVEEPEPFFAVGNWYDDFDQTSDAEVRELLEENSNAAIQ